MNCLHRSAMGRQRGAALVVAMLVFAMCTALIVAMKGDFTRLYQRSANIFLAEQAGGDWSMAEVLTPNLGVQVLPQDVLHGVIRDSKRHAALYGGRAGKTEKGSAKDDKEVKELRNKVKQMKAELSALHKKSLPAAPEVESEGGCMYIFSLGIVCLFVCLSVCL